MKTEIPNNSANIIIRMDGELYGMTLPLLPWKEFKEEWPTISNSVFGAAAIAEGSKKTYNYKTGEEVRSFKPESLVHGFQKFIKKHNIKIKKKK